MLEKPRRKHVGLKTMGLCAAGMLLSLGLCGTGFYLSRNTHDGAPPTLDIIGGFFFVISLGGFFVGVLIAISEAISSASEQNKP